MTSLVKYIVGGCALVVVIILFVLCGKDVWRKPWQWAKSLVTLGQKRVVEAKAKAKALKQQQSK